MPTVYDFFYPLIVFLGSDLTSFTINYLGPVLALGSILSLLRGVFFNV